MKGKILENIEERCINFSKKRDRHFTLSALHSRLHLEEVCDAVVYDHSLRCYLTEARNQMFPAEMRECVSKNFPQEIFDVI